MQRFFILLILCTCSGLIRAQSFDVQKLHVQWEVVENNHQGKSQFLSAFTFTNTSSVDFPASGWTLYFNFIRHVASSSGHTNIERVNGDLFKLYPTEGFQGIKAGKSLRIEFSSSDWVVNFTDAPAGLYLVWTASPDKGTSITNYTIRPSTEAKQYLRFPGDKIGLITPQVIYEQNKIISPVKPDQLQKVFPSPVKYTKQQGTFLLDGAVEIVTDQLFEREASYLINELSVVLGKKLSIASAPSVEKKTIILQKTKMTDEAYRLQISPSVITISASTPAGAFYGIQSLKMIFPADSWAKPKSTITIPALDVEDEPRFGHRAFMLDVSRNFHSKEELLRIIDLLSLYKLNVLHLHFSDDEGWRIEIQSLPELTEVGARRGHSADLKNSPVPSFGSGPEAQNTAGSGYYSRTDYIDILKYATERHVHVIPEIEIPGHARAAILAMNARHEKLSKEGKQKEAEEFLLRDVQDQSQYRSVQGWDDNVVNVAIPSTYRFLEKVMDELILMHKDAGAPLETIHVGGDEVPAGVWQKSPAAQELMAKAGMKSTDDLWYYFYGRVSGLLKKRGLFTYGWEEIAMRKTKLDGENHFIPNPDFVSEHFQVDVWNNDLGGGNEDLAYRLANAGYRVVLSAVSNLYFDMAYYKDFDEPGYYWGAFVDVDKPFYFIPYDYFKNAKEDKFGIPLDQSIFTGKQRLTDYGKSYIAGIQGLIWSENMISSDRLEYMLLPKLLGLAERAWAPDPAWATETDPLKSEQLYNKAWSEFVSGLGNTELPRLDYYKNGFNYRIPSPGATIDQGKVIANIQFPGLVIRYTTDGSEPTVKSPVYTVPFPNKGVIKLRAFNRKGRGGNTTTLGTPKLSYD